MINGLLGQQSVCKHKACPMGVKVQCLGNALKIPLPKVTFGELVLGESISLIEVQKALISV
jgi:hypothetical protein